MQRISTLVLLFSFAVSGTWASFAVAEKENLRPVIGIVSEPSDRPGNSSYIAASYVKWIESAGGRVVPLRYDRPSSELHSLMDNLSGILYPGGGASLAPNSEFFISAKSMFDYAIHLNEKGEHFPVWGTCLGFEFLSIMGAGANQSVLVDGFDAEDLPLSELLQSMEVLAAGFSKELRTTS